MKGLIIKDIINLKKQSIFVAFIMTIYLLFFLFGSSGSKSSIQSISAITGMIIILCFVLFITSFSYDDVAKWDKYAVCLPITRKNIVMSKYILFIIIDLTGMSVSFLFNIIFTLYSNPESLSGNIMTIIITSYATFALSLVLSSILTPFIYKFGVEKSRIILMVIYMVPAIAIILMDKANFFDISDTTLALLYKILPIIIIVLPIITLVSSFFISFYIYENKEL